MPTPHEPGIYIVTLNNCKPISAIRDQENVIKVGCCNIKIGKAEDLSSRENNYDKTFGCKNVNFFPIPIKNCDCDLAEIENKILDALKDYRLKNPNTNRQTEWLYGIGLLNVLDIIIKTLINNNCEYEIIDPYRCKY